MIIDIPISSFGVKEIEQVYNKVMFNNTLGQAMQGVIILYALYVLLDDYLATLNQVTDGGMPDAKGMLKLLRRNVMYAMVILSLPFLIKGLEAVLADAQTKLIASLGGEPKGFVDTMTSEMDAMEQRYPSGPSLFDGMNIILSYLMTIFIKPALACVIRYLYAFYITGRYLYLALLQLVAPIAIVSVVNKNMKSVFQTWVKHMLACYLMIPAFLLAVALSNAIVITIFGNPYTVLGMLFQFFLTLSLLKVAATKVSQLI